MTPAASQRPLPYFGYARWVKFKLFVHYSFIIRSLFALIRALCKGSHPRDMLRYLGATFGSLGSILRSLEAILGALEGILGGLGGLLGTLGWSWGGLGGSWGALGASRGAFGGVRGGVWRVLGRPLGGPGPSGAILWRS